MSEKVRYFLEKSVKEIEDLKKRGIFTQDELTIMMKRRTDYEHKLLSRGVKPNDYLSYAKYEQRAERLRQLRVARIRNEQKEKDEKSSKESKGGPSDWAGPRRITYILERGTKRFPASLAIWRALVDHARSVGAHNVVNKALVSMLRLHPTNPDVWVYVAKYQAEENAAIPEARAVLQRGLRFNADSDYLWLEYMRLELIYVAKILARRKILGIERARKEEEENNSNELTAKDLADAANAARSDADETEVKNLPDVNVDVLGDPASNPALRGDVALAVFDAAEAVTKDKVQFADKTLELFDEFDEFLDRQYLCNHVIQYIYTAYPNDANVELWMVTLPIRHVSSASAELPDRLKQVFNLYAKSSQSLELKEKLRAYFAEKFASDEDLDPALRKAIDLFISRM